MGLEPKSTEAACHALLNEHCMRFTQQEIESLMDLAITKANHHLAASKNCRKIHAEGTACNSIEPVIRDSIIMGMIQDLEQLELGQPKYDDGQSEDEFDEMVQKALFEAKEKPQQLAEHLAFKHEDGHDSLSLDHEEETKQVEQMQYQECVQDDCDSNEIFPVFGGE